MIRNATRRQKLKTARPTPVSLRSGYRNPWYDGFRGADPEVFPSPSTEPVHHRGFLLVARIPGRVVDVVFGDVCLRQMVTMQGGRNAVDAILDDPESFLGSLTAAAQAAYVELQKLAKAEGRS